jgi:O-methyltransferase
MIFRRFLINPAQALIRRFFKAFGYEILKMGRDYSPEELEIFAKVRPYTGTSTERLTGLINAVKYLVKNKIEGDFVECGVWRGGSMMAAMLALMKLGDTSRHFYLFDTYEGLTAPTDKDVSDDGLTARDYLAMAGREEDPVHWCIASLEDVQRNVFSTGYPKEKIHFVKGKVEDTLPGQAPRSIALLRLDTDWYESTHHEMVHLYPLLRPNGVLILDDYGYWQGSRQAVDEYFATQKFVPLLHKLDHPGRLAVKPSV